MTAEPTVEQQRAGHSPWPARIAAARSAAPHLLQEGIGLVPPMSAIAIAATFQTQTMHQVFQWPWHFAWLPAACIEGGVAYFGFLYERHLIAGDSTLANRVWMLVCAAISSATIYWHVTEQLKAPWQMAAVVGCMAGLSLALWMRRAKWKRREELRERGLIDAQAPRFSAARWVLCPVETPRAFRFAVKHGLSDPLVAMAAYRTSVEQTSQHQTGRKPTAPAKPTVRTARPDQTPVQAPDRVGSASDRTITGLADQTKQSAAPSGPAPIPSIAGGDAAAIQTIRDAHPSGLPSLGEIKAAFTAAGQTCGSSRAIRLRSLLEASGDTADPEPALAATAAN